MAHAATRRWPSAQVWLPLAAVVVGALLILGPAVVGLGRSLLVWTRGTPHASLGNFARLFADHGFYTAVLNTVISGVCATAISLVLGSVLAWIVARTDLPGRGWLETLNLIPFFMSPYVGAIAWIYLISPYSGLVQTSVADWLGVSADGLNLYSLPGVVFVLALFYTPYVYLFTVAPLRQMDPALEDAARVHGAGFGATVRLVLLPLLQPALLSAALIVFITSAGLFDVPLALTATKGIRMIPTEIFALVNYPSDLGKAASYGVVITTVTVALALWQRAYLGRSHYEVVSGKGYRPRLVRLGTGARWAAYGLEAAYIGTAVIAPVAALLCVALSPIWTGRFHSATATLANFSYVLLHYDLTRQAIVNSLELAVLGATIGIVLSLLQSYFLVRGPRRLRAVADAVLSLPLGIPGIVLSLFFLILAIRTPLYGTLAILLVAYLARFLPFSTRIITAMLTGVHPELEESARASGATWMQTMRMVLAPIMRPSIIAAWIMLFIILVRELGASILLYVSGTETISVAMVLLSENSSGYVAALALVQLSLLALGFALLRLTRTALT
jgi:iron(III) transport system permease protein